ncbi:MAG: acyltransferase [Gallionella sp.]|nr:acyltransferase [Gallionella sp.]MDD4946153.1 acyltransferase [Gallionella sp.]MDD5612839.1 acyltransferase [Gallionella sp.]
MFSRIKHVLLQIYGFLKFGKRVTIWGMFTVVNPRNVHLGRGCSINHGVFLLGRDEITLGNHVTLSANCMLMDTGLDLSHYLASKTPNKVHIKSFIRIEDNVWVGAGAIILPGVTIHQNSIIGAGSVVTRDVPENVVVAGNPARVIRVLSPSEQGGELHDAGRES